MNKFNIVRTFLMFQDGAIRLFQHLLTDLLELIRQTGSKMPILSEDYKVSMSDIWSLHKERMQELTNIRGQSEETVKLLCNTFGIVECYDSKVDDVGITACLQNELRHLDEKNKKLQHQRCIEMFNNVFREIEEKFFKDRSANTDSFKQLLKDIHKEVEWNESSQIDEDIWRKIQNEFQFLMVII